MIDSPTMTINGRATMSEQTLAVINPAKGEPFVFVPDCSAAQLDDAVRAARSSQRAWSVLPLEKRKQIVVSLAAILTDNIDELKRLLTMEQGKTLDDAAGEIAYAAYWFQSAAELDLPVEVVEDLPERRTETHRVALGVVGAILPWNYPILLLAWKIVPALVAGNCIVIKPSPFTPVTTLRIGELIRDALPAGVVNIVSGGDELGRWMTEHPDIDKISFTGSSATGKRIVKSAADSMKRVTLEMGGNDAAIVFPDVDIAAVAEALFWGAFSNSGQVCVAAKRIYVHEEIYDAFRDAIIEYAGTIKIGDGAQHGVRLGPIQNKPQYDRVRALIEDSRAQGQTVHTIGEGVGGSGYFLPLTIIDNPPDGARVVCEEPFGPVVPLLKFSDEADVVARANDSPFGLAGSVWSADLDRAASVARQLECGTVWINGIHDSPINSPVAGHKQSGLGVENGQHGLLEYTNAQTVILRRPAPVS